MSGKFVVKTATPWKHADMAATMAERLAAFTGKPADKRTVCILHAKTVLETGRDGQKGLEGVCCWNYNVGNVRYADTSGGDFTVLKGAWEVAQDGSIYYPENQKFKAFDSLSAGIDGMLNVLSKQSNFKAAWAVLTGKDPSPEAYAAAARSGGYFTAPLWHYLPPLVSIYKEFMGHA